MHDVRRLGEVGVNGAGERVHPLLPRWVPRPQVRPARAAEEAGIAAGVHSAALLVWHHHLVALQVLLAFYSQTVVLHFDNIMRRWRRSTAAATPPLHTGIVFTRALDGLTWPMTLMPNPPDPATLRQMEQ